MVALLSGLYRHSQRMVQSAMQDLFKISMSLGTVNSLRQEASNAMADSVKLAHEYVQQQPVVGADETSWEQGNADGSNATGIKAWLWVAVTPLVTYFQVLLSRSTEAAQNLLGASNGCILTSDRHGAYNWVDLKRRQLCWAHLRREFIKISERPGVSTELGTALVKHQEKLFELWHRVRDGTITHYDFVELVKDIRSSDQSVVATSRRLPDWVKGENPVGSTLSTCRQLLKVEPAMWLFVTTEGVEPTNNAAERAIRPAVLWRRTSFGSQTQAGSAFVARMLTVVTTLKSQQRNILEFMTTAVVAAREDKAAPSLLPEVTISSAQEDLLTAA